MSKRLTLSVAASIVAAGLGILLLIGTLIYRTVRSVFGPPYGSDGPHSSWCARWAGDVDGDHAPDILLSTPFEENESGGYGTVRVFSGRDGRCLRTLPDVFHPNSNWNQMGPAGDVNGDGRDDMFVDRSDRKLVIDIQGDRTLLTFDTELSPVFESMGDVDGDRCEDLLVGGYPIAGGGLDRISAVSSRSMRVLWTACGPSQRAKDDFHNFGWSSVVVGDVDRDGIADVVVDVDRDHVRVLSGRDGAPRLELEFEIGNHPTLAAAGDVDHDGVADLLVRAGRDGRTRIVSLATGRELASIAPRPKESFLSIRSAGDFDGDGVVDVAQFWFDRLRIHSGTDGRELAVLTDTWFGEGSVDLDDDGRHDLLVTHNVWGDAAAKLGDERIWRSGRLEVLSGRDRSVLLSIDGDDLVPVRR